MTTSTVPTKYLIVGAGPMGLVVARAFQRAGIEYEMVERHKDVGGIWDMDNPGSPMYETCHFITSKQLGGFVDYPMPKEYPTYPSWQLVLQYIRDFSHDYGIREHIIFNRSVTLAQPLQVAGVDAWEVTMTDAQGQAKKRIYRGVVYASGQQWKQFIPQFEGMEKFKGQILPGNQYKSPEKQFKNKRVLVIGAGNSGVDIAVDAAEHADQAYISTRRAYHYLPKQIFGVPTPDLLDGRIPLPPVPGITGKLNQMELVALALATVGDLSKYGLPVPDAPLGSTQPIVNDLILHCLNHGTLKYRPNIKRFNEKTIEFVDGRVEEIDLVLFCTGYDIDIPWLPEGLVDYDRGHPVFHIGAIAPKVKNFYGVGVLHPSRADAWTVFDQMAQIIVADAKATVTGKNKEMMEKIRNEYDPDLFGDFPFLDVRRNANQVNVALLNKMIEELETTYGIEMPSLFKPGFYKDPRGEQPRDVQIQPASSASPLPPVAAVTGSNTRQGIELREAFSRSLAHVPGGAQLFVSLKGQTIVDLAGGDSGKGSMTQQTPVQVFSVSKLVVALAAAHAHAAGALDLDAPLATYWASFNRPATQTITARMVLDHSSGICAVSRTLMTDDWLAGALQDEVAKQDPFWEPGTMHGYHAFTFGALMAGVFENGAKVRVQDYAAKHIVAPAKADFWFGAPDEVLPKLAKLTFDMPKLTEAQAHGLASGLAIKDGSFTPVLTNAPGFFNDPRVQQADWPAVSGVSSARALGRILNAVLGYGDSTKALIDTKALDAMIAERRHGMDRCLGHVSRFGSGVELSHGYCPYLGGRSFGHQGAGGSVVVADPDSGLVFVYTCSHTAATVGASDQALTLMAAAKLLA